MATFTINDAEVSETPLGRGTTRTTTAPDGPVVLGTSSSRAVETTETTGSLSRPADRSALTPETVARHLDRADQERRRRSVAVTSRYDSTSIRYQKGTNGATSLITIPNTFASVDFVVVDPDANRLPEVDWIMTRGLFPTAARVNENAEGRLWMLTSVYREFMGIAERGGSNVDYTWYNPPTDEDGEPLQEPVDPVNQDAAVIVLDPKKIKGMYSGTDVTMGGPMG
ncbi:structural protein VP1 [Saline Natrinema sp. J7-1 virus 1]|uniref:Structural protein VP1 n=1 Tax=Saline Natrinema sp. J7-1 virus 1 TaxID=2847285 RepID=A0AAF0AJR5_9VIRU|nr:structural protein VP1 [Saline Natrinema sp. J7-1 virus 1]WBE14034.1 structural protein VP1 [Saline Natrinema sp. J7-1 virus 1]